MADNVDEPTLPPGRQKQQIGSGWYLQSFWETPPLRRNNVLYDTQPNFVPPPPADARDDEINARFKDVLRDQAELASSIERLRAAIMASPAAREIGTGHNQGRLKSRNWTLGKNIWLRFCKTRDRDQNPSIAR